MRINKNNKTRYNKQFKDPTINKTVLWIIDGSLNKQLHKTARLKPAICLSNTGWTVKMVTSELPNDFSMLPINFIKVTWPAIYLFGAVFYYLRVIRLVLSNKIDADVLFFQMDSIAVSLLFVPLWQSIIRRREFSVVLDYRSLPMDTKTARGKLRSIAFKLGAMLTHHMNIKVTAITEQLVTTLKINKNQILGLWPSGVDHTEFAPCLKKRAWPRKNDPIRLIYIGSMASERNLTSVIKAARIAKDKGIDLRLSIVGDGKQRQQLIRLAKQQGNGYIQISGPYPYHEIPDVLTQHDIGILPFPDVPQMNVSSAIKMFEYMAAGMPIIATRILAHLNVFDGKSFVFWCNESAESIAKAIEIADFSKKNLNFLGNEAKNFSYNWSWENSAKKLSSALLKAI